VGHCIVGTTRPSSIVSAPVLTPSICILYDFLSSRITIFCIPLILVRTGLMTSSCLASSAAVWSALVDSMILPCLLQVTLRCLDSRREAKDAFIFVTISPGSCLSEVGIPLSRNCATILVWWWASLGLDGMVGCCEGTFGFLVSWPVLVFGVGWVETCVASAGRSHFGSVNRVL
jgi:hypothetical protein